MSEEKFREKLTATEERFLNFIIDNDISNINPIIRPDGVIFSGISGFETSENETIEELLFSLTDKGYFFEQEFDRSIFCPSCGSIHVYSKLNCPRCASYKVNRHELVEHPNCGYIGSIEDLTKNPRGFVCPNCNEIIRNKKIDVARFKSDYLIIGSSYSCDNCGHKFDKPNNTHHCQECGMVFNFRQASYEKLYNYVLTNKIEELIPSRAIRDILRTIESQLIEKNFQVELNGQITGKTGEIREFDLIAERNNQKMVLEISSWGKKEDILNLLGKKLDVDAKSTVMVDLSGNNTLDELGKVYNIKTFNGKDPEFIESFLEYIKTMFVIRQESKGLFDSLLSRPKTN